MVVRLRLARHGTRNNPFYHIVAINDSKPRDARPIEKLGEYDPIPRPVRVAAATPSPLVTSGLDVETRLQKRIEWNEDRIKHWLKLGAQPSKPVARLLDRAGLIPEGVYYKGMFPPPSIAGQVQKVAFKPTPSEPEPASKASEESS